MHTFALTNLAKALDSWSVRHWFVGVRVSLSIQSQETWIKVPALAFSACILMKKTKTRSTCVCPWGSYYQVLPQVETVTVTHILKYTFLSCTYSLPKSVFLLIGWKLHCLRKSTTLDKITVNDRILLLPAKRTFSIASLHLTSSVSALSKSSLCFLLCFTDCCSSHIFLNFHTSSVMWMCM